MSELIGVGVRRRRSRVEAERLVLEFEQSGLTRQAFCAQRGVRVGTLDHYRKHWRPSEKGQAPSSAVVSRILPVEFVGSMLPRVTATGAERTGLRVELGNGRRIAVAQGFDAPTLERLLVVLEKVQSCSA